jgi:hypothetical protein
MFKALRWLPLCGFTLLLAPSLFGQVALNGRALPFSVQSCDTQCQSNETDCDLACDQVVACVEECKKTSAVCVQQCRDAPPPTAKPGSSAKPPIVAEKRAHPDKKAGAEKKPPAPAKPPAKAPAKP